MSRTTRRSGLRIGHLVGAVAVSALVMGLLKFPLDYALPMVSAAGFLMIGSCLVAAVLPSARGPTRARSSESAGFRHPGLLVVGATVAVVAGVGFARSPMLVVPVVLGLAVVTLGAAVALFATWATGFRLPEAERADRFRGRFLRNLAIVLVVIAGSLAAVILREMVPTIRPLIPW